MYQAIREIQTEFRKAGLKCGVENKEDSWILQAGMAGEKATYQFLFIKKGESGNDVSVLVLGLPTFPRDKILKAYRVLNDLQEEYRFIRFTVRSEGHVVAEYDFPTAFAPIGGGAVEMILRLTKILDECYPVIARAVWS